MLKEISPVGQLLERWLLLPLFAHVGMILLVVRATRGRAGISLSALLALFALMDIAAIWPKTSVLRQALVMCKALLPAMVAAFVLSYVAGRHLPGRRIYLVLALLIPALAFAAVALAAGWTAEDPAVPLFSLAFFCALITFLLLSDIARPLGAMSPSCWARASL